MLGDAGPLSRVIAEEAGRLGNDVTILGPARAAWSRELGVNVIPGDRRRDLGAFAPDSYNVVIDLTGYLPSTVRLSAEAFREAGHYIYLSSTSVYAEWDQEELDEYAALAHIDPAEAEAIKDPRNIKAQQYGALKAMCEGELKQRFRDRCTLIRTGMQAGPEEPSGRFTYWVSRVAEGGEVLSPGTGRDLVQFVDQRDLGAFMVRCAEAGAFGPYNVVGPRHPLTFQEFLHGCKCASGSDARFVWASEAFLSENEVRPWVEMPMWLPSRRVNARVSPSRALRAGLELRAPGETIVDTLSWFGDLASGDRARDLTGVGVTRVHERELIRAWRERGGAVAGAEAP